MTRVLSTPRRGSLSTRYASLFYAQFSEYFSVGKEISRNTSLGNAMRKVSQQSLIHTFLHDGEAADSKHIATYRAKICPRDRGNILKNHTIKEKSSVTLHMRPREAKSVHIESLLQSWRATLYSVRRNKCHTSHIGFLLSKKTCMHTVKPI